MGRSSEEEITIWLGFGTTNPNVIWFGFLLKLPRDWSGFSKVSWKDCSRLRTKHLKMIPHEGDFPPVYGKLYVFP